MMEHHFKIARAVDKCIALLDDEGEQNGSLKSNQRNRKSELTLVQSMAYRVGKGQKSKNRRSINPLGNFNLDEIQEGLGALLEDSTDD